MPISDHPTVADQAIALDLLGREFNSAGARLIFLNRFFYPDHSATSQILGDLAFHLAEGGATVHVITSRQIYDRPDVTLANREIVRNVTVHRVRTTHFGRRVLAGRALDYASFYLAASWELLRVAQSGDIVIAKTDPPLVSVLASLIALFRRCRTVNWLQDLYPEIAAKLGLLSLRGPIGRVLLLLRNYSLRAAAANVVIGEDMSQRLAGLGIHPDKISIVHNWSDDDAIRPEAPNAELRNSWSLSGKFVVVYSGNLGRVHDYHTILRAAERLKRREQIMFLLVGGGRGMEDLKREVRERGLKNVIFRPYQPREVLSKTLAVADVHWLSLRPEFDGLLLPSKFYGIAAAGRPIIVIGSGDGELARIVTQTGCGVAVEVHNDEKLAGLLSAMADEPECCRQMGARARALVEARFGKAEAFDRWRKLLAALTKRVPTAFGVPLDSQRVEPRLCSALDELGSKV